MSNQSQYKAMMGEVHASADLIGKVKGIPMEKTKKRTTALKFATATCAALLGPTASATPPRARPGWRRPRSTSTASRWSWTCR